MNIKLDGTIKKIKDNNKIKIICGDFNCNLLNHEYNNYIKNFIDVMYSHLFQPCITEPIRIVDRNKPSLIDNIFINTCTKSLIAWNIIDKISDHLPNFLIIQNLKGERLTQKIQIRNMKNFELETFSADLEKVELMDFSETSNLNQMYNRFHQKLLNTISKNAPKKTLLNKEMKLQTKPWIDIKILDKINEKNKLYKKFIKTQDTLWYTRYKNLRDDLKSIIDRNKKSYLKEYFQKHAKNSKETRNKINQILNNKKSGCDNIYLSENGIIITDPKQVTNQFTNNFVTVAENLTKKTGQTNNKYQDYLKNSNERRMYLTEIEPDEIKAQIKNLNSKKVSDIFDISANLLKFAGDKIIQPLTFLFNESIRNGIVPEKLKLEVVYPIHKKDSKMKINNYHPISILPMISKIYEKPIYARLMSFSTKNKTIHEHQFGFQKSKSTEHAILGISASILKALEKKEKVCCIFLDFVKAFDTVNHEILLTKLEYYGVRGVAYELMKSYLSERLQCVKISQTVSDFKKNNYGIPQGSILGPLLFLIYINNIYTDQI